MSRCSARRRSSSGRARERARCPLPHRAAAFFTEQEQRGRDGKNHAEAFVHGGAGDEQHQKHQTQGMTTQEEPDRMTALR